MTLKQKLKVVREVREKALQALKELQGKRHDPFIRAEYLSYKKVVEEANKALYDLGN